MGAVVTSRPGAGKRVLLIDHQDSFVHTLANYLRQTGADVVTLRSGFPEDIYEEVKRRPPYIVDSVINLPERRAPATSVATREADGDH